MGKHKNILIGLGISLLVIILVGLIFGNQNSLEPLHNPSPTPAQSAFEGPPFVNTIWSAKSISNYSLVEDSVVTVHFEENGKVSGFDGCNSFSSGYTLTGDNISIDKNMVSTRKACSDEIMKQADSFTALLVNSTSYKLGDGQMSLLQGTTEGLTFLGQSNPLAKTSWGVTGYNNGKGAVVSPITDTNPTIVFGDDGNISGNASCNSYSGTYSLNGSTITIGTIATTRRECVEPSGIMEQESSFLTYLQKAKTWSIQGNILYLRTAEDQLAVVAVSNLTSEQQ